jgi:hypothetical protein
MTIDDNYGADAGQFAPPCDLILPVQENHYVYHTALPLYWAYSKRTTLSKLALPSPTLLNLREAILPPLHNLRPPSGSQVNNLPFDSHRHAPKAHHPHQQSITFGACRTS